ncbi:hypothetical protein LCGC14_2857970 [marine sediment metagenome]|uniref:Uncharacterized protein n=1 Tax=marine sediment metagenome TaxID=412755 RepID=A0A0F9AXG3_9ZZZZ|nr:hypothetical protein [bacterium]
MVEGRKTKINETERVYDFGGGDKVVLKDVRELIVRPSGTHRITTKDKRMHIIPTGWIHIAILSPKDWVV